MLSLIQFDLATLAAALLIGVAAGRWAFARKKTSASDARNRDPNAS